MFSCWYSQQGKAISSPLLTAMATQIAVISVVAKAKGVVLVLTLEPMLRTVFGDSSSVSASGIAHRQ